MDNATQKLAGLADTVRTMSGTVGKLSVDDMASIASSAGQWGVHVPNLVTKDIQSGHGKVAANSDTADLFTFSNVDGAQTYSAFVTVKNIPARMHLRLFIWDKNWAYAASKGGISLPEGESGKLNVQVKAPEGMLGPGIIRCSLALDQKATTDMSIDYENLMLNEGDYAPYTSATKPYTVDDLVERITALENKLGGVVKAILTALTPVRGCAA